jgi:hypothetical protein
MKEILPGVVHWTTRHPDIGMDVSSYLLTDTPERSSIRCSPPISPPTRWVTRCATSS